MSNVRVSVPLDDAEANALINMAEEECRHPREQLRFLLRTEATRRGILSSTPNVEGSIQTGDCLRSESRRGGESVG